MKRLQCQCGEILSFENSQCLRCNRPLGFIAEQKRLVALENVALERVAPGNVAHDYPDENLWAVADEPHSAKRYRQCSNYYIYNVCNWLVEENSEHTFCLSCRCNKVIPNLNNPTNLAHWYKIESSKRRLFFSLLSLDLPIVTRDEDPHKGLAFQFMEDIVPEPEMDSVEEEKVMTGHLSGVITINILEADSCAREAVRQEMNEPYRTLLGHFRHEIGHYYWERLIEDTHWHARFRELFGDETLDYATAMNTYYNTGAPEDWQDTYISQYASSHPWEDWAECWAHYMHIVDTVETAADRRMVIDGKAFNMVADFVDLIISWQRLSVSLNALNRSMGVDDAYPFVINTRITEKLKFIHEVIESYRSSSNVVT